MSEEEAEQTVSELERKDQDKGQRPSAEKRFPFKEHENEMGLRSLAIDPKTNKIVANMSNVLESLLGYDPRKPRTRKECIEDEKRA